MGNNRVEHTLNKVVFLDRDGTLNEEVNYLHKTEDMKLLPGVPQALKKLKDAGYKLISNDFTDHTFGDSANPKQFKFQFRHKITELTETVRGTREINYEYYRKAKNPDCRRFRNEPGAFGGYSGGSIRYRRSR